MTKQKSGWKKRLKAELDPIFEWIKHYIEIGKLGFACQKLRVAEVVLRKIRVCGRCGDDYYHDSSSMLIMCDDCEEEYLEEQRLEETPEQRRDSDLEQLDAEQRGGAR